VADRPVTSDTLLAAARRTRLHPALAVGIVYVIARLITTTFLIIGVEIANRESGGGESLQSLSMRWDGQWYWLVADSGYPSTLPLDGDGNVTQNAWAFLPLYPALMRVFAVVFGGQYPVAAVFISLVAGYLACLVFFHLLRDSLGRTAAMWVAALFAAGPLAVLFQMAYAESLFLLWLMLALLALVRRRFGWLHALIPLMGYTRPGVLAFALLLGLYGIRRWLRRRDDPLPATQVVHIVMLGLLAAVVGFSWQVIAGIVTGDPSAYLETELSWRRGWTGGDGTFVPLSGFIEASAIWFRIWGLPEVLGYVTLGVLVVGVAAVLLLEPHVRRLDTELRLWSASYLTYLLLVFFPQSSIFRLLLPLAPLYGAVAVPKSTAWRVSMLVLGLVGQWWWIYEMLVQGKTFAQIP